MNKVINRNLALLIAVLWSVVLMSLQFYFYDYYQSKLAEILTTDKIIRIFFFVSLIFGIGELMAASILTKEKFIKFNAIYTFTIVLILTIGASILAGIILQSFNIIYFISYFIVENGMNHVPLYTFFSLILVNLFNLFALLIPQYCFRYFKYSHKNFMALIVYFILISFLFTFN